MKKLRLLFLLFLIISGDQILAKPSHQTSLEPYPWHNDVVAEFFRKYNFHSDSDTIEFAKKRDGWYVCEYKAYPKKLLVKEALFWSKKREKYLALKSYAHGGQPNYNQGYLLNGFTYLFDRSPYYGYNGWDKDVISDYGEAMKSLDDTCLEGLARAYCTYAQNFTRGFTGYDPPNLDSIQQLKENDKISGFLKYKKLELACYDMLRKRNPRYETFVARIGDVYGNEVMDLCYELWYKDRSKESDLYFNDNIYSESMLTSATNYLESCEKDAILFTNGDNDTYPLWYLQEKKGYRRDVCVINLSLLNTSRYIDLVKARSMTFQFPLQTTLKSYQYEDGKRDFLVKSENPGELSVSTLLDYIARTDESNIMLASDGLKYFIYPCSRPYLVDDKTISYPGLRPEKRIDTLFFDLKGWYLTKSDLLVMDLIANNIKRHPVYFAATCADNYYAAYQPYVRQEGLAMRLTPFHIDTIGEGDVNTSVMYKNIVEKFVYPTISEAGLNSHRMIENFRIICTNLIEALIKTGKKDSARIVLMKCLMAYPNEQCPFELGIVELVNDAYSLGEIDLANDIAKCMCIEFTYQHAVKKNKKDLLEIENVSWNIKALKRLERIVRSRGSQNLADQIKLVSENYNPN
jgi:hypothetical protein